MLNTGPDYTSIGWKDNYYDKVLHDFPGYLRWINVTKSSLSHADGCVQNFLKALKERFINCQQSKKSK